MTINKELTSSEYLQKGITKLVHSNKDHSYRLPINPDDWQWIHHSCHMKYDMKI